MNSAQWVEEINRIRNDPRKCDKIVFLRANTRQATWCLPYPSVPYFSKAVLYTVKLREAANAE